MSNFWPSHPTDEAQENGEETPDEYLRGFHSKVCEAFFPEELEKRAALKRERRS